MKKNFDGRNMRKAITDFPQQFRTSIYLSNPFVLKKGVKNIVVCGMGGSAWPTNILNTWLEKARPGSLPIYIHRDYNLPAKAQETSLIVCSSYSGNTEESISALEEAIKKGFTACAIASGGKVEEICQKNQLPFVKIPPGLQPRLGTGYLFKGLAEILAKAGVIGDISKELETLAQNLEEINLKELEPQGRLLAEKITGKIPLIYASNNLKVLARVWKIKINENSKSPAFYNYFPELNHNEMNGFVNVPKNSKMHVVILRDGDDHPRILKRMDIFSQLIKGNGIETDFVNIRKGEILFKLFSTLLLGEWVSYYLALAYGVDPTPVQMVEEFKKKMTE